VYSAAQLSHGGLPVSVFAGERHPDTSPLPPELAAAVQRMLDSLSS
jgi:hypothetical protein